MLLKLLKTIFKLAIVVNFFLYMIVHLAADRLVNSNTKFQYVEETDMNDEEAESSTLDIEKANRAQQSFHGTLRTQLKSMLKCKDRDFKPRTLEHGDFWVLKNFVRANHGAIYCHETVTLTTHADLKFLDNLVALTGRWQAPISLALFAPGDDFGVIVDSIKYLRSCLPESHFIHRYVTFHIYFPSQHIPRTIKEINLAEPYHCSNGAPYANIRPETRYRIRNQLVYPVNTARNIARQAALTHFVLASDIELYPSSGLVEQFIAMLVRLGSDKIRRNKIGFALPIFEIEYFVPIPNTKSELRRLYRKRHAVAFHEKWCKTCQGVQMIAEWIEKVETSVLGIFRKVKRRGELHHWEPIFIGTHDDPYYEERMSWEGRAEKMPHAHILCVLNYDFYIFDNAFLVHKPGVRLAMNLKYVNRTARNIQTNILPNLNEIYGTRRECHMFELCEKSLGVFIECKIDFMKNMCFWLLVFVMKNKW